MTLRKTARKPLTSGLLAGAALALSLAACGGAGSGSSGARSAGTAASMPAVKGAQGYTSAAGAAPGPVPAATGGPKLSQLPPSALAEGPRVIRTAQLTLEVGAGHFDGSLSRVIDLAAQEGGYIAGTTASATSGRIRTGTVTFEVPAAKFQDAIARLRKMGRLQSLEIGGQDVSSQYVDLEARLKNEEAMRDAVLALLARATAIGDIISIQDRLGQITQQIEEYKGQLDLLDHQTSYSTVTATLEEAPPVPAPVRADNWGLAAAAVESMHAFARTLGAILIGLGAAGPALLILAGLAILSWRRGWWRRKPGSAPA